MTDAQRRDQEEQAEAAERAYGPRIVGFFHRFEDGAVEARYLAAQAPHASRRLASLIWVALCVTLTRIAGPSFALYFDPGVTGTLVPRVLQVMICGTMLVMLKKPRRQETIEAMSFVFVVSYLAIRCWLLPSMGSDGSVAMIIGTLALLYFGSPLRVTILAPVLVAGSGAMFLAWNHARPAPSTLAQVQVLEWLVVVNLLGIVAMRLLRGAMRRQFALAQALRHLATHDGLTGIANRRHYDMVLAQAWKRCQAEAADLSLILLDVDFFKLLNDGIGHAAGDECLRSLANLLTACVTAPGALVARTGGEEFAVLLPGTDEEGARNAAERIAHALRTKGMPHPGSPLGPHITISLGVATAKPAERFTLRDLTGLADHLVYAAKRAGRNCIRQQRLGHEPPMLAAAS